jgi:rhodanese-related sulfurtransferase
MKEVREFIGLVIRAFIIAMVFAAMGLAANMVSPKSIPLVYEPPNEILISGVKVPLVNEHVAHDYFADPTTSFLDTRQPEDYSESRVKGSLGLTPDNFIDNFPEIQPLLPIENRIVLYCYGPECDMAERVAKSMIDLGYKNLVIMSAGFRPWEAAGYPIESKRAKSSSKRVRLGERAR